MDRDAIVGRPNCPEPPLDDLHGYYVQITFLDEQFGLDVDERGKPKGIIENPYDRAG